MKKAFIALLALALLVVPVAAQEEQPLVTTMETEPGEELITETGGIAPDSPLYVLDTLADDIALALTFDPEAKAELGVKIAEERLMEAKEMAKKNRTREMNRAIEEFGKIMNRTRDAVDAIPDDGRPEIAERAARATARIQARAENVTLKALIVIQTVSEKVLANAPEQARDALTTAFEKIEAHLQEMQTKMIEKRAEIKLKIKSMLNATQEQVEAMNQRIDAEEGLVAVRERIRAVIAERTEVAARIQERLAESNITESKIKEIVEEVQARIETRLQQANATAAQIEERVKERLQEMRKK